MNKFSGCLYYLTSDNAHLEVADFIVREDGLSFSLDSVSAEYGRWAASGRAVKDDDGAFRAAGIIATQRNVKSDAWAFEFKLAPIDNGILFVEGHVKADGEIHPFSGDLDRKQAAQ